MTRDVLPTDGRETFDDEAPNAPNTTINSEHDDIIPDPSLLERSPREGGRKESLPPLLQRVQDVAAEFMETERLPLGELLKEGDTKNSLDFRTDLNDPQIIQFSRARIMADEFGIPALRDFVEHIERMSVSRDRKGRKEFVDSLRSQAGSLGEITLNAAQSMQEKLRNR